MQQNSFFHTNILEFKLCAISLYRASLKASRALDLSLVRRYYDNGVCSITNYLWSKKMQNPIYDELYDGFDGKQMVYEYDVGQDEAYQNALKVSSYGKRSTPKTFTVRIQSSPLPSNCE
jgi:hypothetical protein